MNSLIRKYDKNTPIILASNSKFRANLLENAGIEFEIKSANIDERSIEAPLLEAQLDAADISQVLAEAKAQEVSARNLNTIIIGCDQTLSMNGHMFHKPANMKEARQHLLKLSGNIHQLNSGITLVYNEETLWRHVSTVHMTVRDLSPAYIGRYLAKAGDRILGSVGAYQLEAEGVQLFERIDGDYFTIIGLPLLPLLAELRMIGIIDG